jgi:integrase
MYGCGLRFGEAVNIRVGCLDLENKRVHIVNRAGTEDVPPFTIKAEHQSSSSKERSVPIPEATLPDIIEAMKGAFGSGGFLVLSKARYELVREHWRLCREGQPWGGHAWRPWQNRDLVINVLRNTQRYLRWAQIELNGSFNLHTFRKSYAQNLANAGVPPRTLTQLLGHSTSKVTIEFYSRVTDSNQQAAAEVMNRLLTSKHPSIKKRTQGS